MLKSKLALGGLASLTVLGLAACSQSADTESTETTDTTAETVTEVADEIEDETTAVADADHDHDDDEHDHDGAGEVHEHGKGEMAVTLDGSTLSVSFVSPLASFASFEHEPETDAQRQMLESVRANFMRTGRNFGMNAEAGCEISTRDVSFEHKGDHGSVTANYAYNCATPDKLNILRVKTFATYPALEEVNLVFLTDAGQQAKTVTAEDDRLLLE
ncbi:MAG: DUF2796 domain-containing protein [Pseudomonadota bacterium]